jgi:hypothetical protein
MSIAVPMPSKTDSKMRLQSLTFQSLRRLMLGPSLAEVCCCESVLGMVCRENCVPPGNSLDGARKVSRGVRGKGGDGGNVCGVGTAVAKVGIVA